MSECVSERVREGVRERAREGGREREGAEVRGRWTACDGEMGTDGECKWVEKGAKVCCRHRRVK